MYCIGVNYKKVPVEIRERYAFSKEEQAEFYKKLRRDCGCIGAVILSTCNRSEIYFCGELQEEQIHAVEDGLAVYKGIAKEELLGHIYRYGAEDALRHLFRVASGLDSMILGEDEILRQVKDAYQFAVECEMCCNEIHVSFQGAMSSAKSIKTNTLLSKTPVSAGTLAANRIEEFLQMAEGKRVLMVGITGKIGGILAKNLRDKGITDIIGVSRGHGRAEGEAVADIPCAAQFACGANMVDFSERYCYVDEADVIVSATSSPHYTFLAREIANTIVHAKRRLFVDLAVPRDIDRDIKKLPLCEVVDIDDFKKSADSNNLLKLREMDKAELILTEKLEETKKSIYMSTFMDRNGTHFAELRERSFGNVFFQLKEQLDAEQLRGLLAAMERLQF